MICKPLKLIMGLIPIVLLAVICQAASAAGVLLGDVDGNGAVTSVDATSVQRKLAELPITAGFSKTAADVDGSGEIEITDATYIQRWLANLKTPYPINDTIESPAATEAATQRPTDNEGWGRDIYQP